MSGLVKAFAAKFGVHLPKEDAKIMEADGKIFLLNQRLMQLIQKIGVKPFYAGIYLGQRKRRQFAPGFMLLYLMAENAEKRVYLNDKAAWLFVCGRDVFPEGVFRLEGVIRRGDHVLLFNRHGECLGYGLMMQEPKEAREGVLIKNLLDVGDFLRREKGEA